MKIKIKEIDSGFLATFTDKDVVKIIGYPHNHLDDFLVDAAEFFTFLSLAGKLKNQITLIDLLEKGNKQLKQTEIDVDVWKAKAEHHEEQYEKLLTNFRELEKQVAKNRT